LNKILDNFTIKEVFTLALNGKPPYPHQLETAKNLLEGRSVVLRAPCGSGKTEACYVSLLLGRNYGLPNRLIYSLPTRALVEDVSYRIKKGISKIGLPPIVSPQHGANSEDPFFKSEIVVATIDQTVGAYCCTPLSLPVYLGNIPAGAAVSSFLCFDEAHVYDHMLGLQSMLVLVERTAELGLPFLVMSATLPDSFIEWFRNNEKFSDRIAMVEGKDEDVPKRRNRRVILRLKGKLLECKDVLDCADSWRRIMVVCNTVDRAQELFGLVKEALESGGFDVFLLHSRFLDEDREVIEDKMKACLKDSGKKTCLITTQVCEVGLDISCDMLLTELAPPDSLIQRIGRCAREGGEGEVWVFEVEHYAPYNKEDMERSRKYISERLNDKRIGWNEELEFVNTLLEEEFKQIMNDKKLRLSILKSLGDSAFTGNRKGIEDCVRDILTTNITIHDNPDELKAADLLGMPWIDIDVRVLNNRMKKMNAKFWLLKFERDEEGKLTRRLFTTYEALPYEYYVIPSYYSAYSPELGLTLSTGKTGIKFEPSRGKAKEQEEWDSKDEAWVDHVDTCLKVFDLFKLQELSSLKLLGKLLDLSELQTEGVVALCLVLHDLGKLNVKWQKSFGINKSNPSPIAKATNERRRIKPPPHAPISAYASYWLLERLMNDDIKKTYALHMAIGHHHHTRAERGCDYVLGWLDIANKKIIEVSAKYNLNVDVSLIKDQDYDANLAQSFPGIEKIDEYSMYCMVSRFIRLCDRTASKIGENSKNSTIIH
jgi:CRISPR-associated endonuclease/helicase Cas3